MARVRSLLDALFRRRRFEEAMADEIRFHLDARAEDLARSGVPRGEAERRARAEFGGREGLKEACREARGLRLFDELRQDIRYAIRLLGGNPVFTVTAALSVAIGIGANTTVFSIANRLLLREIAGVPDANRLVDIGPTREGGRFSSPTVPYAFHTLVSERATSLSGVYGCTLEPRAMSLTAEHSPDGPERVFATLATPDYFTVLGVRPAAGRFFDDGDADAADGSAIVVLSHRLWMDHFGGDGAVVGRVVRLNGQPTHVIGVAPPAFRGTNIIVPDVWVPITTGLARREGFSVVLGGRLKDGVRFEQAAAEIAAIGRSLESRWPPILGKRGLALAGASAIPPVLRVPAGGFIALLTAMVCVVLAIACANLAGVLLAKATARRREIAVRLAMGAGRARVVRQLLTEAVLLFALGGAFGVLLARWMTTALVRMLPTATVPVDTSLPLDARVLLFTAALSFVAAVLSGLLPALQASRSDVVRALKDDVQGPSGRVWVRHGFVIVQVACSLLLIVGAGLLARALHRTGSVDLGFDPHGVDVTSLDLSLANYTRESGPLFAADLVERARRLPGVTAAALAVELPGGGEIRTRSIGRPPEAAAPSPDPGYEGASNVVGPGYFSLLGIPILAGRDFTDADRAGSTPVAIVSQAAARELWPGEDPVGQYIRFGDYRLVPRAGPLPPPTRMLVIGLVRDLRPSGGGRPSQPIMYRPFAQQYSPRVSLLARTSHGQRVAGEIRSLLIALNPYLPIVASRALDDEASPVIMQLRLSAAVAGSVGLVGVLLAAIGIYGVTAYSVTRRTREIGVRIAMGAGAADVMWMILRQGMTLVAAGAAIGLPLGVAAGRVLSGNFRDIPPFDPVVFGAVAVLFGLIGFAACYVPARRATRIDAMQALRAE